VTVTVTVTVTVALCVAVSVAVCVAVCVVVCLGVGCQGLVVFVFGVLLCTDMGWRGVVGVVLWFRVGVECA